MFGMNFLQQSISSASNYLDNGGMWSFRGMADRGPSKYSMSVSMYRGGARGSGRPRTAPPDLPSLLLDARIVYLGMPVRCFSSNFHISECDISIVFLVFGSNCSQLIVSLCSDSACCY